MNSERTGAFARVWWVVAASLLLPTAAWPQETDNRPAVKITNISLRELSENREMPEAASFFGATRVVGFTVAESERGADCILVVRTEAGRPRLRVDDFAVAYQNARGSHQQPACTIDPRREVLMELAKVSRQIMGSGNPATVESALRDFERLARADQDVRVFNVDADTHYAQVMVEADYYLKRVSNGTAEFAGITSYVDRVLAKARSQIHQTGGLSMPMQLYSRFWFNAGEVKYGQHGQVRVLKKCRVKLLTEDEAMTVGGGRLSLGTANPSATSFAADVTSKYGTLAKAKPIYRELENLYRFSAIAELMVEETADTKFARVIDDFLSEVDVERVEPTRTLPGQYAVERLQGTVGNMYYQLWLPSCGGVSIGIKLDETSRDPNLTAVAAALRQEILKSRPSEETVVWTTRSHALVGVEPVVETPIEVGHRLVTVVEAPFKAGQETLFMVSPGTELQALQLKGPWVLVEVQREGRRVKGWIHMVQLAHL